MKLLPLNCNNCGAPLEAPAGARFLTCSFCNSRLSITQTGSTFSTQVLESIDTRTQQIAEDVAALRQAEELRRLDHAWEAERAKYMTKGEHGTLSVPTRGGAVIAGLSIGGFGLIWTMMTVNIGAPDFFPLFGILFILVGVGTAIWTFAQADRYQQAHDRYERKRRQIHRRQA